MLGCRAYEGKRLAQKARGAGAKQGAETKKERKKKGVCENKGTVGGEKILEALASGWLAGDERRAVGCRDSGLERAERLGEERGHGERQRLCSYSAFVG